MKGWSVVYRRELAGLFLSPLAWILFCLTLFYNGFFFLHYLENVTAGEVNEALMLLLGGAWPFWLLVMFLPPLLTMRMISEESRSGLLEFLLTAPVGDGAVVTGKALAATTFMTLVWTCLPIYGLVLWLVGAPPDWGVVASAWLGAVLVSALFSAVGLAASALSSTPLLAAFLATLANVVLVFLPLLGSTARGVRAETLKRALGKLDVMSHFQGSFQTGALDSAHLVFYVAWTGVFLFLTVRLIERHRWL